MKSPRAVSSRLYDREYYLTDCSGYREFLVSRGEVLEPRMKVLTSYFPKIKKGMRILDVGCGRGELSFWASKQGALTIGVDYSKTAIEIANSILNSKSRKLNDLTSFEVMNLKKLKFKNGYFDQIFFIEVLEHLYNEEKLVAIKELTRVLKKGGQLMIHTEPNKYFDDIGYRYWSYPVGTALIYLNNFLGGKYTKMVSPSEIRKPSHKKMHIGEENYFSLRGLLDKALYNVEIKTTNVIWNKPIISWKDRLFNTLVFMNPLSKHFPFNIIFGQDFFIILTKK